MVALLAAPVPLLMVGCDAPAVNDQAKAVDDDANSAAPAPFLPSEASAIVRLFRQDAADAMRRSTGQRTSFNGDLRRIDRTFPGLVVLDLQTGDSPEHLTVIISGDGVEQTRAMRVGRLAGATCANFDVSDGHVVALDCQGASAEDDR